MLQFNQSKESQLSIPHYTPQNTQPETETCNVLNLSNKSLVLFYQLHRVADPEGGRGSKIGQNLAKSAPFLPILASTPPPPLTDHPGSAPDTDKSSDHVWQPLKSFHRLNAQRYLLFLHKNWVGNNLLASFYQNDITFI